MQPNTSLAALSPRFPWALHCSCLCAYYTIFGNFWVTSRGRRSGKKSILRAVASFAAVRKVMLTSWWSTLVMYGRDTFMRLASSVCDIPSSFIRSRIRRRNAEPMRSMVVMILVQSSKGKVQDRVVCATHR